MFINLKVFICETKQMGTIIGTFGKSGKLKVRLDEALLADAPNLVNTNVELRYKKNMMKKKANKFK